MQATALSSATDPSAPPAPNTPQPAPDRRCAALLIACITIALERFGFYTLVSLFVLFLTERRGQSEGQASTWYGVMMGATYFTPLFGGALADRFGRWLCICIGAFLLACAYGLLTAGFLPLSIILLSIGNGTLQGQHHRCCRLSLSNRDRARPLPQSDSIGQSTSAHSQPVSWVAGWRKHYGYSAAFLSATGACLLAWCLWISQERLCLPSIRLRLTQDSLKPQRGTDWRRSTCCSRSRACSSCRSTRMVPQ
jgi:dipeptide/tripeptide permease